MSQNKREQLTDDMILFMGQIYHELQVTNKKRDLTERETTIFIKSAEFVSRAEGSGEVVHS